MKFNDFLKLYVDKPFVDSSTFALYGNAGDIRRQVNGWLKHGYLLPLKKGLYIFGEQYRKMPVSPLFIANFLVTPSYVSMEYALGYYGFIPEKVVSITSVTTKKTRIFKNAVGRFSYRTIKRNLFFGFTKVELNQDSFFIAQPEKALCDYLYLDSAALPREDYFEESMRLQNTEKLSVKLLLSYKDKYDKRTGLIVDALVAYIKKERSKSERSD